MSLSILQRAKIVCRSPRCLRWSESAIAATRDSYLPVTPTSLASLADHASAMESLYSIDNFEDGDACHEINSPRTLEACLRNGLDPSELMPKSRKSLTRKYMSEEMIDLAVSQAQWKRGELLKVVKEERARLMSFAKKKAETAQPGPSAIAATEMSDEQKSTT